VTKRAFCPAPPARRRIFVEPPTIGRIPEIGDFLEPDSRADRPLPVPFHPQSTGLTPCEAFVGGAVVQEMRFSVGLDTGRLDQFGVRRDLLAYIRVELGRSHDHRIDPQGT
jgi:hypothetical protein